MISNIPDSINMLGRFCGRRDVDVLSKAQLSDRCGIDMADVMILFGGSIIEGGDVLAEAMKNDIAHRYVIVGGAGHTTDTLRKMVNKEYPSIKTKELTEAEIFQNYLRAIYGCQADLLETRSTNCGNNITYMLELLKDNGIEFNSIILCQDATMQQRMDAGLRQYTDESIKIINYASYKATVISDNNELKYQEQIHGMWDVERYINLLMGEIPRLTDDENGYGPAGKGFIAHVDIPEEVQHAFEVLKTHYQIRDANPKFAS